MPTVTVSGLQSNYSLAIGESFQLIPAVSGQNQGQNTIGNPTLPFWGSEVYTGGPVINAASGVMSGTANLRGVWSGIRFRFIQYFGTGYIASDGKTLLSQVNTLGSVQVRLYSQAPMSPITGLDDDLVYTLVPDGTQFGLYAYKIQYGGQDIAGATPQANVVITSDLAGPAYSDPFTITVADELPDPEDPDFLPDLDFCLTWDTQTGGVVAPVFATAAPAVPADAADLPASLRLPLIIPAKLGDSHAWQIALVVGERADSFTSPTAIQLTLWDPESAEPIVAGSAEPTVSLRDGVLYYGILVNFERSKFEHIVSRAAGSPAVLFDAELRASLYGGKTKASRSFRVWLEDSTDIAA